ncbi:MAG: GNAT family N-acetyltransferase [Prevotella sp.]|nr:GNAT family N-acetyltransferase [Prevotella sp.]CDE06752.1 acetyltransferase GNAT family [Prevotella sp. CAG:485]
MQALWKEVFGDSGSYIQRIFRHWADAEFTLCRRNERGETVAMLCARQFAFTGGRKGLYLHGLATRPDHRGQGLMTQLIDAVRDKALAASLDFLFLIPASESLRQWYSTFGFKNAAERAYLPLPEGALEALCEEVFRPISPAEFNEFDRRQPPCGLIHSLEDAEAVLDEWTEAGGTICGNVLSSDKDVFVLSDDTAKQLADRYLSLPAASGLLNDAVATTLTTKRLCLYPSQIPLFPAGCIERVPYGMTLPLKASVSPEKISFSLMMD